MLNYIRQAQPISADLTYSNHISTNLSGVWFCLKPKGGVQVWPCAALLVYHNYCGFFLYALASHVTSVSITQVYLPPFIKPSYDNKIQIVLTVNF